MINTAKAPRSGIKREYSGGNLFALLTNAVFPSHGSVLFARGVSAIPKSGPFCFSISFSFFFFAFLSAYQDIA
jgi:hypothetical protein